MITTKEVSYHLNAAGHIQVLEYLVVTEDDGTFLGRTEPHARSIAPGENVSAESPEIKQLVAVMHTPARIAAYQASIGG